MTQPVNVTLEGISLEADAPEETITSYGKGNFLPRDGKYYLSFQETGAEGPSSISHWFEISPDAVRTTTKGPIRSGFHYRLGQVTKGEYETPMGIHPYELYTQSIHISAEEDSLTVTLEYALTFPPEEPLHRRLRILAEMI